MQTESTTPHLIEISLTNDQRLFLLENLKSVLLNLKKSEYRKDHPDSYNTFKRIVVKLQSPDLIVKFTASQRELLLGYLEGANEKNPHEWYEILFHKIKEYEV